MSVGCRIVEKIELNEDQRKRVEKEEKQQVLEKRMKQNISAITEENKGEVVNRVQTSPTRLRDHSKVEEIRIWIDQAELHLKQVTDLEILLHCCHCFFFCDCRVVSSRRENCSLLVSKLPWSIHEIWSYFYCTGSSTVYGRVSVKVS